MIVFSGSSNSGETDVESLVDAERIELFSEREDESENVKKMEASNERDDDSGDVEALGKGGMFTYFLRDAFKKTKFHYLGKFPNRGGGVMLKSQLFFS